MIKNVRIKRFVKKIIFPSISLVNKFVPKKDNVVFLYCANGGIEFCNLTLRTYLLNNGYERKYKIVCGVHNKGNVEPLSGVSFVWGVKSVLTFFRSKHVFYTAGQLPIKPSKNQCVIHMQHGNADFKAMGLNTNINNGDEFFFTYIIVPSDLYVPICAKAYNCDALNVAVAGDPMCDDLLTRPRHLYDFSEYSKFLIWLPTFRQSENMGYNDSRLDTLIPLFDEGAYQDLENLLAKYNIRLIVKLHPAQTTPKGAKRLFKHLSVYSHREFVDSGYDMYTLIAHSDGLIGDYSSASMQYLLMNRPMAFVVPDLEDYRKTRGFAFEHPEDYMGGHIVKTKNEFYNFIEDFAQNKDVYKEKRQGICNQIYKYHDANSCKRIVELSGMTL